MKLFHPKRWLRNVVRWYGNSAFRIQCRVHHIHYEIGENARIWHCRVRSKIDGTLVIGDGCWLQGAYFSFYGSGGRIELKDNVKINAYPKRWVSMFVKNRSSIVVEGDCLFSNTVEISTTDWHRIYDAVGHHLNPEKDVHIGRRVWIGRNVVICKGCSISDNSVVGVGSIVTKPFNEKNVVIAGNPAEIKKRGIHW